MKEKIDSLLELLKQLSNQIDPQQILKLEEKIQQISLDLKREISESSKIENNKELKDQVFLLRDLINSLEKSKISNNKIFTEFQNFIKDRKFK